MKPLSALLLAALLLPMALPAQAQAPVATHLADDNPGDVKVTSGGQSAPPPADAFAAADLKALDAQETPDAFVFTLAVASLKPQAEAPQEGATTYTINFEQHDRIYRVRISRQVFFTVSYSARLEGFDPGRGGYFTVIPVELTVDDVANTLTTTVPRQSLLDANGAAPHPEIPLTGFHVASHGLAQSSRSNKFGLTTSDAAQAGDTMPDTGNATTELTVHFGVRQTGHARMSSEIPTRASNGEATTFVFQVTAANLGTSEDTFQLTTTAIPPSWIVKLPASQITVPGNASVNLPVLVTTPFTHSHGSFQNFIVHMKSITDPGTDGAIQLGIRYTQPPQPAGHHNQLWLHSDVESDDQVTQAAFTVFGGGAYSWMNALDSDPTDAKADVPARNAGTAVNGGAQQSYAWEIPLSPGLEMGLDFDTTAKGLLNVNIKSPALAPAAVLQGYLAHFSAPSGVPGPGQPEHGVMTVLADITPTAAQDLQPNSVTIFGTDLVPRQNADFVPFEKGASLVLFLNLTMNRADTPFGPLAPAVVADSNPILTMPLIEYHDPVNDIFLSDVELVVTSPQDRFANPGQMVLFNVTLQNHGAAEATYLLAVDGTNSQWSRLLPAGTMVVVPAAGEYKFSIVVNVPADVVVPTSPGADKPAADLVLAATNQADFNQRALVRLYTTVDNAPHSDDAAQIAKLDANSGAKAKTPGFEAGFALAALALVALAVARRRKQA